MTKFHTLIFSTLIITNILSAQSILLDSLEFNNLKPRNIGPAGMSGRVTSIDVVRNQPDIIYIGSASGGVWRSDNGGIKWTPIFDNQPVQSIGAVKINQQNPSEIWVGTGEGNPRNSHNYGAGIFKSIDGGKTWKDMGLNDTRLIHRIIIDAHDPNTVYVGVLGSAWGKSKDRGVYKTTDGGATWKKILYVNEETGVADMVVDPTNPNKIMVAMWEFGRKPWTFNSGGKGSGIYLTYDGGKNWKKITGKEGLPKETLGRIGLAIAPSEPNIVYALIEAKKNALYKSTDGGENWKKVSDKNVGNRPFYYSEIYVDPQNENRIWNLWSYVSKSEDGGKTFKTVMDYGNDVHPDHHAFYIHPDNPDFMINGNDGGLNISRDRGENWRFIENLPLAQFYHIDYDMDFPYHVAGGMQDNGSWVGPSSVWKRGGIRNADWQEVLFGDGFDVLLRRDNNRYGWAMSQGGNIYYFDRETGNNRIAKPMHPEGKKLRFHWNAALAQDPYDDCGIYFGSQYLHHSDDCGKSWTILSPDLTTNDKQKQEESAKTGGLTPDVTGAENFTTIISIAPSPVDKKVIWVGTDDGNLQLTQDGGDTWKNLADQLPSYPKGSWIPQIEVSKRNAGEAFVIVNNYRRNDYNPYLYHTKDFGKTWKQIANKKQVKGHTLAIVQDPVESNLLFLGTDFGLYVSFDEGKNWQQWKNNYPAVSTRDLKIHPREHDLIIGTFGRAAWILDDIRFLRAMAKEGNQLLEKELVVFDPVDTYLASYRSVDGMRFKAQGSYVGTNKPSGALFTVWVKPEQKEEKEKMEKEEKKKAGIDAPEKEKADKKEKKKGDKAKVQLFTMEGDTIYTFYRKLKPGFNRMTWNLSMRGPRMPSRQEAKPESNDPYGWSVLPGTYKAVITNKGMSDSTLVNVSADPRIPIKMEDRKAKITAQESFAKTIDRVTESFDRLVKAKKTTTLVDAQMVNVTDSVNKDIKKLSGTMRDSIGQLMNLFMLPEDTRGYVSSDDKLTSFLWKARTYIGGSEGAPSQMAQVAIRSAEEKTAEVIKQVDKFFDEDWKKYREQVEQVEYSLFE